METSQEPSIYVLLRVTFGDKPSPDMASFVMLKIAEENRVRVRKHPRFSSEIGMSMTLSIRVLQRKAPFKESLLSRRFSTPVALRSKNGIVPPPNYELN